MSGLQWGWCEQEIRQELPDLSVVWLSFSPRLPLTGPSPEAVRARLLRAWRWIAGGMSGKRPALAPLAGAFCARGAGSRAA